MFLIIILVAWFVISGMLQAKLAKRLGYKNPKEAFIPVLSLLQLCKMTGRKFKITEIFKACEYLAEIFGERKFFGKLLLAPFLNILALNHLLKNRNFFIRDEFGRQIIHEIQKGLEQEVDVDEIRQIALTQGVAPELFEKSHTQSKMIHAMAGKISDDEASLLPKNFIMTLFFLGIGIFIGILFLISRPYLTTNTNDSFFKSKTAQGDIKKVKGKKIISAQVEEEIPEEKINPDDLEKLKSIDGLELEDSVFYSAPIDSDFVMEIDTTVSDPLIKGTGLGGLITDGIIKVGDKVKILSKSKEVLFSSKVSEISIHTRSKGKQKLQMAQTGQDVSLIIEKALTSEEKSKSYFLVK